MDDKDGLTAWAAIRLLFPEPKPGEPGFDGGFYDYSDLGLADVLWPGYAILDFRTLLQESSWSAMGRRVPVDPPAGRERIQPDLWDFLDIDLDNNSASGGGLEYAGLLFFEAKPEAKKTIKAENGCREWLIEVMQGERKLERQLWGEAEERFPGLSDKAFKRAFREAKGEPTTHESWRKRGPIKS